MLVNRWCVFTKSCQTLISGINISHGTQPCWRKFQNVDASEQEELTCKPDGNCPLPSSSSSVLRPNSLSPCWWCTGLSTVMWTAVFMYVGSSHTTPLLSQGSMQLNKEIAQPHLPILCCKGGTNVGTVSPQPLSKEQHIQVDNLLMEK